MRNYVWEFFKIYKICLIFWIFCKQFAIYNEKLKTALSCVKIYKLNVYSVVIHQQRNTILLYYSFG